MQKSFLFSLFLILFVLSFSTASAQTTSCLKFPSSSTPFDGYAPSWDVFDSSHPLLIKTNCPTSGTSLNLTVGRGDASQLIYNLSYSYHPGMTPPWQPHTLSGTVSTGSWLAGIGTGSMTASDTISDSNPFFFVGYTCQNRSGVWKCGCANTSCTSGKWQLQAYKGIPPSGTAGGSTAGGSNPICGNNICESGESHTSCSQDCDAVTAGHISDITFDNSTKRREAYESDNWPVTWAADGNLYAAFGDGGGFGQNNNDGRVQLGFARITGDWNNYVGKNIWGGHATENPAQFGGYDYALISIKGVLWAWPTGGTSNNQLIKSTNMGKTWTRLSLTTTALGKGMGVPTFVNMGKDYADAFDNYLYINGRVWLGRANNDAYMARVPIDQIENKSAYETFTGISNGQPTWSHNFSQAVPTYTGDVHWASQVAYIKGLNKFVMINNAGEERTQDPSVQSDVEFLEADKPWGPWRRIKTFTNWMPPGSNASNRYLFMFDIPGKWQSADGKDFTLVYTGTGVNDSWNTIRGHFITN